MPDRPGNASQVLFVCSGNTCRSPMAEGILKSLLALSRADRIAVASAGTGAMEGEPVSAGALDVAAADGISLEAHRARRLTRDMVMEADLILALDRPHLATILALDASARERAHLLRGFAEALPAGEGRGVVDPVGGGPQLYNRVYAEIHAALEAALARILALADGAP
jgi:protein-tyrosine phosphatase